MRFIDTNVFVYSFLKTKRELKPSEIKIKKQARKILQKIDEGEKAVTSTVHLSECVNIIEAHHTLQEARAIINSILQHSNIEICSVDRNDYLTAVFLSQDSNKNINDCLAVALMNKLKLREIYSFDSDFDSFTEIIREVE